MRLATGAPVSARPPTATSIQGDGKDDNCQLSKCSPPGVDDLCSGTDLIETARDNCVYGKHRQAGEVALCCPAGSIEDALTTLLGVESHQFPHFARVEQHDGRKVSTCGGSIYNDLWIITASHCVVDKPNHKAHDVDKFKVVLGIDLYGTKTDGEYDVEEIVVHEGSTLLDENGGHLINDLALLKLKKKIDFGVHVKGIAIAQSGFTPLDYADHAIIVGFGKTDTLMNSQKLQKADTVIREDARQVQSEIEDTQAEGPYHYYVNDTDQLIFLGGLQDNIDSPSASSGDSGGPAICRGPDGNAVLCGATSLGHGTADQCEEEKTEKWCWPVTYVELSHFHDWIVAKAGDQDGVPLISEPLYGTKVGKGEYESQVHIESADDGHKCGGTLLTRDTVVTAAHCVVQDDGNERTGLSVVYGTQSLTSVKKSNTIDVEKVTVLPGFKRNPATKEKRKRIAIFSAKTTYDDALYENDLAVVKLKQKVNIGAQTLPQLAQPGDNIDGVLATEVAFRTNKKRYGDLDKRSFNLLSHDKCQKRVDRLSYKQMNVTLDADLFCGVEKYSGGSLCDRELGGGLFCDDGKLCGVQAFRLCEFNVPVVYIDVAQHADWIEKQIS
ncbi:unnamed protein product [Orchesella dallaii]|uniref:Peptidase S1 domain-containing protein n=1 Tax=Orchesella dallaii TaxID=48710 RepID=A0ABP1RQR6_9HEXA